MKCRCLSAKLHEPVRRLTLLAPEIVEAILDGRQPAELQLDDLLEGFPVGVGGPVQFRGATKPSEGVPLDVNLSACPCWQVLRRR